MKFALLFIVLAPLGSPLMAADAHAEEPVAEAAAIPIPRGQQVVPPDEIKARIDQLYVPGDDRNRVYRVKSLGTQAIPLLVAELKTDRAYNCQFPKPDFPLDDRWAFNRLCDALQETCPAAAAEPLARFATHQSEDVRRDAALLLGKIGTEECVKPLTMLLAEDDVSVRNRGMMGMRHGLEAGHRDEKFLTAIFPALERLLVIEDSSVEDEAPGLLLMIDRERAVAAILDKQRFHTANKQFASNLAALNKAHVSVPHELLLPQLRILEPQSGQYPQMYAFAAALLAYARNPDADAAAYLQKQRSENESDTVRENAAKGLAILAGVEDADDFVTRRYYDVGWQELTAEQQNYRAVFQYDLEVSGSGHNEYFINASGEEIGSVHRGLIAIGAQEKAKVLAAAIALFDPPGPAADGDARLEQLDQFSPEQSKKLRALDDRYHENEEVVSELLANYVLKNASHFRPQTKP